MWTSLGVRNSRGRPVLGDLQKPYQILTVNIGEKFPHASSKGRRKVNILKYARACQSSEQDLPSKETILPEPNLLGFYQSLTDAGGRGIPNSSPP